MHYKVENIVIEGGLVTDTQDLTSKRLNQSWILGRKSWRLHTFTPTVSTKGINIVIVWEAKGQ